MAAIVFRTISSIFYIGGLAMTGIGGWYDYQQTLTMPYGPFELNILLWGIIIASLGSFLLITQMRYRIWRLESDKPNTSVEIIETINNDWCLNVTNKGEKGNFEAQIALCAVRLKGKWISTEEFSAWKGIWTSTNTNNIEIMRNHHESLKLVHQDSGRFGAGLQLLAYDFNTKSAVVLHTFFPMVSGEKEIMVRILVVISSHPSPKSGVFEKIYKITPFDMVEIKPSIFSKIINLVKIIKRRESHKEGSQP